MVEDITSKIKMNISYTKDLSDILDEITDKLSTISTILQNKPINKPLPNILSNITNKISKIKHILDKDAFISLMDIKYYKIACSNNNIYIVLNDNNILHLDNKYKSNLICFKNIIKHILCDDKNLYILFDNNELYCYNTIYLLFIHDNVENFWLYNHFYKQKNEYTENECNNSYKLGKNKECTINAEINETNYLLISTNYKLLMIDTTVFKKTDKIRFVKYEYLNSNKDQAPNGLNLSNNNQYQERYKHDSEKMKQQNYYKNNSININSYDITQNYIISNNEKYFLFSKYKDYNFSEYKFKYKISDICCNSFGYYILLNNGNIYISLKEIILNEAKLSENIFNEFLNKNFREEGGIHYEPSITEIAINSISHNFKHEIKKYMNYFYENFDQPPIIVIVQTKNDDIYEITLDDSYKYKSSKLISHVINKDDPDFMGYIRNEFNQNIKEFIDIYYNKNYWYLKVKIENDDIYVITLDNSRKYLKSSLLSSRNKNIKNIKILNLQNCDKKIIKFLNIEPDGNNYNLQVLTENNDIYSIKLNNEYKYIPDKNKLINSSKKNENKTYNILPPRKPPQKPRPNNINYEIPIANNSQYKFTQSYNKIPKLDFNIIKIINFEKKGDNYKLIVLTNKYDIYIIELNNSYEYISHVCIINKIKYIKLLLEYMLILYENNIYINTDQLFNYTIDKQYISNNIFGNLFKFKIDFDVKKIEQIICCKNSIIFLLNTGFVYYYGLQKLVIFNINNL